jgi:hypothetical protein
MLFAKKARDERMSSVVLSNRMAFRRVSYTGRKEKHGTREAADGKRWKSIGTAPYQDETSCFWNL